MRLATFDLEISRILPSYEGNLTDNMPLGVACAGIAYSDRATELWKGVPQLNQAQAQQLVARLQEVVRSGYTLVSWNGCSFDLRVLAHESGMFAECGELALHHVDLMAFVTFHKGYFLKLDRALQGSGVALKLHAYTLPDGRVVDPSGVNAPILWAEGLHEAVLAYQQQDVEALLELARIVDRKKRLTWLAGSGKPMVLPAPDMLPMRDCFRLPVPDTSWMSTPGPTRRGFVDWIPGCTLK